MYCSSHYNDALQICANLDAFTIKTKAHGEKPKDPYKHIASAQERKEVTIFFSLQRCYEHIHVQELKVHFLAI